MRKPFKFVLACAISLIAFTSCTDKEDTPDNNQQYDDVFYATQATITSSDTNFSANDSGGAILFKTEGGTVTLNVNCGCEWLVENTATDLFATSMTSTTLDVTAEQNTEERLLTGTITLKTANQKITFATINITQSAYGAPEISVNTNEWNAPAVGTLTIEIAVEATTDWIAEPDDDWIIVTKTGNGIGLVATENVDTAKRSSKVTLICTDGISTAYEYIMVNQDGVAYITLSNEIINFASTEESITIDVDSNFDWDYSYDSFNGWVTVSRNGDKMEISAMENDQLDDRSLELSLTASDGAVNTAEAILNIVQDGQQSLVITLRTARSNKTVTLPLSGTVNCAVNWGDGNTETITSTLPTHTYPNAGEYNVSIKGTVSALNCSSFSTPVNPDNTIVAVKQWGNTGLKNMQGCFSCCSSLESLPDDTIGSFSSVTSFQEAFGYTTSLKSIPDKLFAYCSNVTTFYAAFYGSAIYSLPEGLFDNCNNVTNFACTFYNCTMLTSIPAELFVNCSKVTTVEAVFYGDKSLSTIPSGLFDKCPNIKSFQCTFYNCENLKSIPKGLFDNCQYVTTFEATFCGCKGLTEIPAGLFDRNTANTTFRMTFQSCNSIEVIPEKLFDSCTEVTDFYATFYGCTSLKCIPDGLFNKCTMATTMHTAFYNCYALTSIPAGIFDNCPKITDFQGVFYGCTLLTKIPKDLFVNCTEATTFNSAFYECKSLLEIPEGLFDNCTEVTTFYMAFQECESLKTLPENMFNSCSKATDFMATFQYCTSLESIPVNLFDGCTTVTTFKQTFNGCTSLRSLPAGLFDKTLNVTEFNFTFNDCFALTGESPYTIIWKNGEEIKVHLYERSDYTTELGGTSPKYGNSCFSNCTGLTDYNEIVLAGWN